MIEFKMPSLGADMEDGLLVEWKKHVGDTVHKGEIIAEVETQKGDIEIEVFDEGVIEQLVVQAGQRVPVGTVLALIRPPGEAHGSAQPTGTDTSQHRVKATPIAKRLAAEHQIDVATIKGTGEDGAVTKEDVEAAAAGKTSHVSLVNVRQAVANAMSRSNREIPHYYLSSAIDVETAMSWMAEHNLARPVQQRLLPAAMFIKAAAKALVDVPALNATWEGDVQLQADINIGFVVSLRGGGVIVPSISNTDTKSIDEIMDALNDIIPRARDLRLKSSELSSSTITMTSLGEGGADEVFGVIYPPQVAVIGIGGIAERAVVVNGAIVVRRVVHITLGGDHRATDGLTGSKFLASIADHLQRPELL